MPQLSTHLTLRMIRAVLTDIEGTTSSLSFVKDELFPYARARLPQFVQANATDPQVRQILADARGEVGATIDDQALIGHMLRWIDEDRKLTALKALQGLIWEAGYRDGELVGHIYPDAVAALRRWHESGLQLYVFSSGSVKAQQLLFGHTDEGDLRPLFSGYFDTTIGNKRDTSSYGRIADAVRLKTKEMLFLSDIVEELDAARTAGMDTCWLVRDGDIPAHANHPVARQFEEIRIND